MKKIIPFQKEITFKTNLSEIVSISLEHTLHQDNEYLVTGEFIVSGEYKMADISTNTEVFSYQLPFDISIDEHYDTSDILIDIDDFYYEIINDNILKVSIDVALDGIKDKPLIVKEEPILEEEPVLEEVRGEEIIDDLKVVEDEQILTINIDEQEDEEEVEDRVIPIPVEINTPGVALEIPVDEKKEITQEVKSLFDNLDESSETFKTYKVYIVRETDTLETIMQKYSITKENLELYNDIKEIKYGDKLVIPFVYDKS